MRIAIPANGEARAEAVAWPAALEAAERRGWNGMPLAGVTEDSRAVRPGSIFVAHRGQQTDGHRFVEAAVAAGASLVVCERPMAAAMHYCLVPDGRLAFSALAAAWFHHPARRLRIVGITGTNGKTTSVHLAAGVLAAAGLRPCTIGTLGVVLGQRRVRALPWTTPPAGQLHAVLAEVLASGADSVVMEVSAQGLSQARVADCPFEVGAITNLAREHREYYPTQTAYVQAKLGLFEQLGQAAGAAAHAVLNRALAEIAQFRAACRVPVLEYGAGGDVQARGVRSRGLLGSEFALRLPGVAADLPVQLHLPGLHNVDNALCAAGIGMALQIAGTDVAAGLAAVTHVPGRLQHVAHHPVRVLVDYAHNPAGLRALLRLLRPLTRGRLVVVMGARGGRDQGKRPLMGGVVAAFADQALLTSDRPAGEDPAEAAEPMRVAIADCGVPVRFVADRLRALETALAGREPGDCVVAVGKGEEPWQGDSETGETDDVRALEGLLSGTRGRARAAARRESRAAGADR